MADNPISELRPVVAGARSAARPEELNRRIGLRAGSVGRRSLQFMGSMNAMSDTHHHVLIFGASYGSLLAAKLVPAGHDATLICLPDEADLINADGIRVRIPALADLSLDHCYTDAGVWANFDPARFTIASPDPQAFRPPDEPLNVLQVSLPTNSKVAAFEDDSHTATLRRIEQDILDIRFDPGDGSGVDLLVKTIGESLGMRSGVTEETVALVNARLDVNRAAAS